MPLESPTGADAPEPLHGQKHGGFVDEACRSFLSAGIASPTIGVAQLVGQGDNAKQFFADKDMLAHERAELGSEAWAGQLVGGAIGTLIPFYATKFALGKMGLLSNAASAEASVLQRRSVLGMTMRDAAVTGFAMGAVFTPSNGDNAGQILSQRAVHGVESAATLSALTAGSIGVSRLSQTSALRGNAMGAVLRNPVAGGVLSGVPGGLVSAEAQALAGGKVLPDASDAASAVADMSLVGGLLAVPHAMSAPHSAKAAPALEVTRLELARPVEVRSQTAEPVAARPVAAEPVAAPKELPSNVELITPEGRETQFVDLNRYKPPEELVRAKQFEQESYSPRLKAEQSFPELSGAEKADVVVIGSGIAGLRAAQHLRDSGKSVVLLTDGLVGNGASRRGLTMITEPPDAGWSPIVDRYGPDGLRYVLNRYDTAKNSMMDFARTHDTDFQAHQSAAVGYGNGRPGLEGETIKPEFDLLREYHPDVQYATGEAARAIFDPVQEAVILPKEGSVNSGKLIDAMMEPAKSDPHFRIYENSPAIGMRLSGTGGEVQVTTPHGTAIAGNVVFATGGINAPFEYLAPHMDPIQAHASFIETPIQTRGNVFDNLYPSFNYYTAIAEPNTKLFGGGGRFLNHETAQPTPSPRLDSMQQALFPGSTAKYKWNGLIYATEDGLPILERHRQFPQVTTITGLGGIGNVNAETLAPDVVRLMSPDQTTFFSADRFAKYPAPTPEAPAEAPPDQS